MRLKNGDKIIFIKDYNNILVKGLICIYEEYKINIGSISNPKLETMVRLKPHINQDPEVINKLLTSYSDFTVYKHILGNNFTYSSGILGYTQKVSITAYPDE